MASEQILQFLSDQNRPFSANDVAQNVDKGFGKSAVLKALDKLVAQNKVMVKTYGKQSVYCIVQPKGDSNMHEQLRSLDKKINETAQQLVENESKIKTNLANIKQSEDIKSVEELRKEYQEAKDHVLETREKLERFAKRDLALISDEERNAAVAEREKMIKEFRKRKRLCMDIINAIMESYPKTKKQLMQEAGLETDEDVGFVFNE